MEKFNIKNWEQFKQNKLLVVLGILILVGVIATLGFAGSKWGCGGDEEPNEKGNSIAEEGERILAPGEDITVSTTTTSYGNVEVKVKYDTLPATSYLLVTATDSNGNVQSSGANVSSTGSATINLTLSYGTYTFKAYIYPSSTSTQPGDIIAESSPQSYTISGNTTISLTINYSSNSSSFSFNLDAAVSASVTLNQPPVITLNQSMVVFSINNVGDYINIQIPSGALTVNDPEDGNLCNLPSGADASISCNVGSNPLFPTNAYVSEYDYSYSYSYSSSQNYNYCIKTIRLYQSMNSSAYSYSYSTSSFLLSSASNCTVTIIAQDPDGGTSSVNLNIVIPSDLDSTFDPSYSYSYSY